MVRPPQEATANDDYITEKSLDRESQLLGASFFPVQDRVKAHAEQSYSPGNREKRLKKEHPGRFERRAIGDRLAETLGPGNQGEVRIFYLQRDGAAFDPGAFDPVPGV